MTAFSKAAVQNVRIENELSVRFWPKADTRGRILGPKFGYPAFSGLLSVR